MVLLIPVLFFFLLQKKTKIMFCVFDAYLFVFCLFVCLFVWFLCFGRGTENGSGRELRATNFSGRSRYACFCWSSLNISLKIYQWVLINILICPKNSELLMAKPLQFWTCKTENPAILYCYIEFKVRCLKTWNCFQLE